MMYQLYILCIMSVVVYAKSDESKYIDLLPEEEKQEFLNRIARRIIEEIQAKDSPEQSHAEVSDDQLNAHHAYVQDLIKEESANRENERKNFNVKEDKEVDKDKYEVYNAVEKRNNFGADRNDQFIDLTLRNNEFSEINKMGSSNDSTFGVIPVKVVYDNDNVKATESSTNYPRLSDFHNNVYEQNKHINAKNSTFKHFELQARDIQNLPINFTKKNENQYQVNIKDTHSDSQVSENQANITSNNDIQIFKSNLQKTSSNLEANSTLQMFTTDKSMVKSFDKGNNKYDDSFENTDTSTQIIISLNKNTDIKDSSPKKSDVYVSNITMTMLPFTTETNREYISLNKNTDIKDSSPKEDDGHVSNTNITMLPFTTEKNTEYISKKIEYDNPLSSLSSKVYVTTVKTTKGNTNIKIKTDIAHHAGEKEGIKTKEIIKNNVLKKHLRKRLQILSREYKVETEASPEKNVKRKQYKNKNIRQYFVYEVPEEEPVFVPNQYKNHNEQPFVVPIYNFAPKHAYYNAYNHFGINNDEEDNVIKKPFQDYEGIFDKTFNLRSSFEIEFNPKNKYEKKNRERHYSYFLNPHSHWKNKLHSKIGYNPTFMYDQDDNFRRKIKRENNFKPMSLHEVKNYNWTFPSKIPDVIKYIPLRYRSESTYDDKPVEKKMLNNLEGLKLSDAEKRELIEAIKTLLYQQQKFAYLLPSKSKTRSPKSMPFKKNGLKLGTYRKRNDSSKTKNIALDYYFGGYRTNNKRDNADYNEQYSDIEDNSPVYQKIHSIVNESDEIIDTKYDSVDGDDDCKYGCLKMHLKRPAQNFDDNLESLIIVLKDMIYKDTKDLVNYDWLLSTVDLESALKKLIDLIEIIEKGYDIHSLDSKLLKYILYLYNTSSYKLVNTIQSKQQTKALQDINNIVNRFLSLLRRRISLPRNKKKKYGHKLTNPVEFWYKFLVREGEYLRTDNLNVLISFKIFLNDLKDSMFELHNAIKNIALITTYGKQSWYRDLKNIYLKAASKKQLSEVILHLAASKLFGSIENTSKNAEEDDSYINNNGELMRRIQEEFIFVLSILERIKTIH